MTNPGHGVVIEQTSKKWKAGMIFGVALVVNGLFFAMVYPQVAGLLLLVSAVGGCVLVYSVFGAWWNHS